MGIVPKKGKDTPGIIRMTASTNAKGALFMAIAMVGFTCNDALVKSVTGAVMIVPLGGWQPVSGEAFTRLAAASVLLLVGYQTIVIAMRTGEISFIAPFRYTSLIWAIAIGFLFFGEVPDFWMTVGVLIIVASGLYTFYRENRRRDAEAVAQESKPESP